MTCIVALTDGKRVVMGGDSAGVAGLELQVRDDRKVFRSGPYTVGFTTSYRMGQVLNFLTPLPPPQRDVEPMRFMVAEFVEAARQSFKHAGFCRKDNEKDYGGIFLVGFDGQIFEVQDDFQVVKPAKPYTAIGSGGRVALGALHALEDIPELTLRERAQRALEISECWSASVRAPFYFVETPLDGEDVGSS